MADAWPDAERSGVRGLGGGDTVLPSGSGNIVARDKRLDHLPQLAKIRLTDSARNRPMRLAACRFIDILHPLMLGLGSMTP